MLTYIYAGKVLCEKCGRTAKLKIEGKAPIFPDDPWSYHSKDYPKGPYYSNERTRGPSFSCAACNRPLGPLVIHQSEGKIIDPWTDSLPSPDTSRGRYGEYIPRITRIDLDGLNDRRRRTKKHKESG